ncbi:Alpha carbonic anhydrase domain [Dillenia turbinata]|uniref:Alpha carbonic anhydrase domain n=1 Tax=Dillenia turbinata TaxID=194707 RepID=A0AAN8ZAT7_9MAGN
MKKNQLVQTFFYGCRVSLLLIPRSSTSQEDDENETRFGYIVGTPNGPDRWSELDKGWFLCNNGTMQSPVDILDDNVQVVSNLGRLNTSYMPSTATLVNRGRYIELRWDGDAGSLNIDGIEYELQQIHWHVPAEHTFNGVRNDLEAHLVHKSLTTGHTAVVGITYHIGPPDLFLAILAGDTEALIATREEEREAGIIDPNLVRIEEGNYYRYSGSLTVPPCDENVAWTLIQKVCFSSTISFSQIVLMLMTH